MLMALVLGIDEAGRGPVIGPLVIAGVLIDEKDEERLRNIGVKDSKDILPHKREELFETVQEIAKNHVILVIEPSEIDDTLNSKDSNLNWLEADKSAEIVNYIKPIPDKTILDCPSNNPEAYNNYVKEKLGVETNLVTEHKADAIYPVVGAASILAKVTRDRLIEEIKKKIKVNFGSGYPSDPLTKEFLEKSWKKHKKIFRQTWASYKKVADAKDQKSLGEF